MLMNKINVLLYNTDHCDIDHIIAKYIKKHIHEIPTLTIDELANACFVSKAKISKFCKMLSYDNYIALKDACYQEIISQQQVLEKQKENLELDYRKHLQLSFKTLENNLCQIDQKKIDHFVKVITKTECIYLYGTAYSYLLCQYMQFCSDLLGKEVVVLDEDLKKHYVMKETDLLIVFSIDGYELDEQIRKLRKLKKYPVKRWLLATDKIAAKWLDDFDHTLIVPADQTEMKERRLLIRYLVDVILGRYQYLYLK